MARLVAQNAPLMDMLVSQNAALGAAAPTRTRNMIHFLSANPSRRLRREDFPNLSEEEIWAIESEVPHAFGGGSGPAQRMLRDAKLAEENKDSNDKAADTNVKIDKGQLDEQQPANRDLVKKLSEMNSRQRDRQLRRRGLGPGPGSGLARPRLGPQEPFESNILRQLVALRRSSAATEKRVSKHVMEERRRYDDLGPYVRHTYFVILFVVLACQQYLGPVVGPPLKCTIDFVKETVHTTQEKMAAIAGWLGRKMSAAAGVLDRIAKREKTHDELMSVRERREKHGVKSNEDIDKELAEEESWLTRQESLVELRAKANMKFYDHMKKEAGECRMRVAKLNQMKRDNDDIPQRIDDEIPGIPDRSQRA